MDNNIVLELINDIKNELLEEYGESKSTILIRGLIDYLSEEPKKKVDFVIENKDGFTYGTVGKYAGFGNYHVGDIVMTTGGKSLIVNNKGYVTVYGWGVKALIELQNEENLKLFKKFDEVTVNDLNELRFNLKFKQESE